MPPYTPYSETDLVSMLKNKDQQAFSYLYDNYGGALYGIIMKVIHEEESAKDLLQEVFVKIWRSIDSYDNSKGKLYTWMLNIARNAAIDVLRSARFNNDKKISELENSVHSNSSTNATSIKTDQIGLKEVVYALKEDYRQILDLAYFKGYTQEEIAQELQIPIGTVKTRARNAIIQLKSIMK